MLITIHCLTDKNHKKHALQRQERVFYGGCEMHGLAHRHEVRQTGPGDKSAPPAALPPLPQVHFGTVLHKH